MDLIDKIKKIEALLAGAKTEGERQAASLARERLLGKQQMAYCDTSRRDASRCEETPLEYSIRVDSHWKKRLFVAICSKYQLRTYRYAKQKHTTTMVRVVPSLLKDVILPEFKKYSNILEGLVTEIMGDLISKIHEGEEEEVVIAGELPHAGVEMS